MNDGVLFPVYDIDNNGEMINSTCGIFFSYDKNIYDIEETYILSKEYFNFDIQEYLNKCKNIEERKSIVKQLLGL